MSGFSSASLRFVRNYVREYYIDVTRCRCYNLKNNTSWARPHLAFFHYFVSFWVLHISPLFPLFCFQKNVNMFHVKQFRRSFPIVEKSKDFPKCHHAWHNMCIMYTIVVSCAWLLVNYSAWNSLSKYVRILLAKNVEYVCQFLASTQQKKRKTIRR